ncbi:GH36-type glycosyl hydrolase domain-containing protein [Allohahella marinimesophila]|uniref:Cyclic beta-(1,2)-glucan synthase n=1 Tax=Allohahella marinimesophila TaxID=1054972 RepID=A0ABP7NSJ8_9GAMM
MEYTRNNSKPVSVQAEYYSLEELARCGEHLAATASIQLPAYSAFNLTRRQDENKRIITDVYLAIFKAAEAKELFPPAGEWLLDNFYLIEENIRQVRRDLPQRFYRELPEMDIVEAGKAPRAMAFAWLYNAHSHCEVTLRRLTHMVQAFQHVDAFRIGELWAIPSVLRFVLIEDLRRLATGLELARQMRLQANEAADKLVSAETAESRQILHESLATAAENDAFASQLLYRLRESSAGAEETLIWLEQCLEARGSDAEEVLVSEQHRLSAENVRIGNIIRSLRTINDIDWTKWFTQVSRIDAYLTQHSNFGALDFNSQNQYRSAIEWLARQSSLSETAVTERAVTLSQGSQADVGEYFIGKLRQSLEQDIDCTVPLFLRLRRAYRALGWWSIAAPIVIFTILVIVGAFNMLTAAGTGTWAAVVLCLLFALPASEAATGLFNTIVTLIKPPSRLVGFEFLDGPPASARTLVVVPCLITSRDVIDDLIRGLEVHYLANPQGEIYFALASDWRDSAEEKSNADVELLDYAQDQMAELRARYTADGRNRFFLLHRKRLFNASEGCWMGWERKRGKLIELNRLLRGDPDTTYLPPAQALPEAIQYVMVLDADTRLTRDAINKLVGKMAHPLCTPVIDEATGRMTSGYAILQPRVTPSLTAGKESSVFQRIFSKNRGLDPYVFTVSDVYQDLTGEGSFTGKGLYNVDAFDTLLSDRVKENSILSHDLLEGSIARSALVSDVALIEDFPVEYEVEAGRQHRWTRGDWQLLPFIFSKRLPISKIGRWKMLDNLRRSLIPGAWILASVLGWGLLPLGLATLWQIVLVISLFVSPTLGLIKGVFPGKIETVPRAHFYYLGSELVSTTGQVLLRIIFTAHTATMMADAILRSLYRVFVSRRKLLEWRTAAQAQAEAHRSLLDYYRGMWGAVVLAGLAAAITFQLHPEALPLALIFCALWVLSPVVAWMVSQPLETSDKLQITVSERAELRKIARRTWAYFETFVTGEHNFLPPDNFQEIPKPVVAGRTSPTNIGVYLLSVISARDFGWISMEDMIARLEKTLATLTKMEKHRGHLYNWYDTRTLTPLLPRYVSSVDSGNLAGHLIALSSACREWAEAPSAYLQAGFDGIADVSAIVDEELAAVPDDRRTIRPLRRLLEDSIKSFRTTTTRIATQPESTSIRVGQLHRMSRDVEKLAKELNHEIQSKATRSVAKWAAILTRTCEAGVADTGFDQASVEELREDLITLRDRARLIAFSMDFAFLMRQDRRLLAIGYRPDEDALDDACYDLLASEARLTSLFAIAKGDVPTEHWFRLGRPIVPIGSLGALVSWSGSMFEYLMPPLVMQEQQGGILNQTNGLIVKRQIEYGRRLRIPWGISEAAFNARDREMTYQYSNFGVPSLGMKRGLSKDIVIAPYASLLASQFQPRAALENLRRLRTYGALGDYGFYDAVDFTPSRLPENTKSVVVRNYMAHHHGMSILAISNVVFEGRLRERFHSDQVIEAAELLLQERAPKEVPILTAKLQVSEPATGRSEMPAEGYRVIDDPEMNDRALALLSNGHYAVMLSATGSGYANWNGQSATRWRPDPVEDDWGTFLFIKDLASDEWWSATAKPKSLPGEETRTIFSDSKAEFHKTVNDIYSRVDVIVGSENDAEGRRITLVNLGDSDRSLEITSYAEPVLSHTESDSAHPAFSKMFLQTEISEDGVVIYVSRNKRRPDEPDMAFAHMVVGESPSTRKTEAETDRRRFIGRGRRLAEADAFEPGAKLSGSAGFTLDPIVSLRRVVRIAAGKQTSLVFWSIAAPDRATIEAAVARYRHFESFQREAMHAWTRSQIQLRYIGITNTEAAVFQRLARYLVYPDRGQIWSNQSFDIQPQSELWPMSISGDFPIFILRVDAETEIASVRKALRAQEYFRSHGLIVDLVILNEQVSSYAQSLQNHIDAICENVRLRGGQDGPRGHIFALRRDLVSEQAYAALVSTARVILHSRNGRFTSQIDRAEALAEDKLSRSEYRRLNLPTLRQQGQGDASEAEVAEKADTAAQASLQFWNGYGGFSEDGREYVISPDHNKPTPQPWINVVSNSIFGFHVSAEGGGFTWSVNSRDYQLTPWSNDPVIDRPGEAIYVVDRENLTVYSPFPAFGKAGKSTTRHGLGYSIFSCDVDGLHIELLQTTDAVDAVKISRLRIRNSGSITRSLQVYGYVEWVLGSNRSKTAAFVRSAYDPEQQVLLAENPYSVEFPGRTAFFSCNATVESVTASRQEFIGSGTVWQPDTVQLARTLSNDVETLGDPCAAMSVDVELEPEVDIELVFLLGDCDEAELISDLIERYRAVNIDDHLDETAEQWEGFLGSVQIDTPDPAMNLMVNTWLPYQSLACRLRARSAFYQASGAFGFRDQLQDTLAFLIHDPALARRQILNAASRQFPEGDVQHWWLPRTGAGVRTMISDDVVWLAYAVSHYIDVTADAAILDEPLPFLKGAQLKPGQHDAFYTPETSETTASLYEHCARALDLAIKRTGAHGLPLILGGDWNDGMNRVGEEGRGESVWLGWFLNHALQVFTPWAEAQQDDERVQNWQQHRNALQAALEDAGWDGRYYRRGYYDDGTPLGSADSEFCRIDSIAQSWSVLSGSGEPERINMAMDAVVEELVDRDSGLVRLFKPAFENRTGTDARQPGYIQSYPPGVRENGGQYTHAATWVIYALAELGRGDDAYACFSMLNPVNHALAAGEADIYRVEPYVVAADVYHGGEKNGRGGWTWYTGSGSWLYRAAVEGILGIRKRGDEFFIKPALPSGWPGYTARIINNGLVHNIAVTRSGDNGEIVVKQASEPVNR